MRLEAFTALLTPQGQALLEQITPFDQSGELALQTRLRASYPSELVTTAFSQARLRERAKAKFGGAAGRMYFTPTGLEQATRASVAELRSRRFSAGGLRRIADLCSGIGGDALALAAAGLDVTAVDRDAVACAVLAANAKALGLADRITIQTADVTTVDWSGFDAVFLDPSRRLDTQRTFDPDAYSPPMGYVSQLRSRVPAICVKVAPGIPHARIPEAMEGEWVSESGDVKEAALWGGSLATGARQRATLLPSESSLREEGIAAPEIRAPGNWLYEPDGAVIRAHLVAEVSVRVAGWLLDSSIAYVCSDRLVRTPFATAYEVLDVMPFQLKRLRAALRERHVGSLTIKKRGFAMDPQTLRRELRLAGDREATIVISRHAGSPLVLFVRKCEQDVPGA